jgi:hypothetical protein
VFPTIFKYALPDQPKNSGFGKKNSAPPGIYFMAKITVSFNGAHTNRRKTKRRISTTYAAK